MPRDDRKRFTRLLRRLLARDHTPIASSSSNVSSVRPDSATVNTGSSSLLDDNSSLHDVPAAELSRASSLEVEQFDSDDVLEPDNDTLSNLWTEAFYHYEDISGVDLQDQDSDLYQSLKGCTDYHTIVDVLVKTAQEFGLYRHPSNDARTKIRGALRPIIRAVLNSGVLDASGELAATSSVPGGKALFVAIGLLFRATKGVSDRFDAVVSLLERFENYMRCLDIRIDVPLEPNSRIVVVNIFVEMLRTFAIVTQMMRKSRLNHFLSVLTGGEDTIADVARRFEALEVQDTRLILTSVYKEVCMLSGSLYDALSSIEDGVALLNERMEVASAKLAEITVNVRSTADMVSDLRSIAISMPNSGNAQRGADSGSATALSTSFMSRSGEAGPGTAEIWRICLTITCLNAVSNTKLLADNILSTFDGLPPGGQADLMKGFAVIYSIAACVASDNIEVATSAALLNPATFASTFIPLAMAYVAAFLCGAYLPRALGHSRSYTIIIIDVLGDHALVPLDRYLSWADIHALLLERFANKDGAQYVRSGAYKIMDTAGESTIIKPATWAQTVKAGMILEMSIVVRQMSRSLRCPCCHNATTQAPDVDWVFCTHCKRQYRTSSAIPVDPINDNPTENIHVDPSSPEPIIPPVSSQGSTSLDAPLRADLDIPVTKDGPAQQKPQYTEDMALFRRITIELSLQEGHQDDMTDRLSRLPPCDENMFVRMWPMWAKQTGQMLTMDDILPPVTLQGKPSISLWRLHAAVWQLGGHDTVGERWPMLAGRLGWGITNDSVRGALAPPMAAERVRQHHMSHLKGFDKFYGHFYRQPLSWHMQSQPGQPKLRAEKVHQAMQAFALGASSEELRARGIGEDVIAFVEQHRDELVQKYREQMASKQGLQSEQAQGQQPGQGQGLPPGQQPPQLFGPLPSARELKGVRPDGSIDPDMYRVATESVTKMKRNIEPQLTARFQPVEPPIDVDRNEWMAVLDRAVLLAAEIEKMLPTFIAYTQGSQLANILSKYVGQIMVVQFQKKLLEQYPARFIVDLNALRGFVTKFSNLLVILRNRITGVQLELQQLHGADGPRPTPSQQGGPPIPPGLPHRVP
ncbi:hypothetical protein PENSPDRAFT_754936 [Peniophora sp. CONT]|nr:hypothetical protein PENSPDRAFT_754936 [Peniophora sp. CONT]